MKPQQVAIVQVVGHLAEELFWQPPPMGFNDKTKIRESAMDWRESFSMFLSGYAFEHQGRSPHFAKNAVAALMAYPGKFPSNDFEERMWETFCRMYPTNGKGVNRYNNPLYKAPQGTLYTATGFVGSLGAYDHNLTKWASSLAREGRIKHAWDQLVRIRGVGHKIASLFLRDIVYAFGVDENSVGDKKYLQPIDRWTKRAAESLAVSIPTSPKSYWEYAQVLVDVSEQAGVPCALTNSGLWTLGSQLVQDEEKYRILLQDIERLRSFLNERAQLHEFRAVAMRTAIGRSVC